MKSPFSVWEYSYNAWRHYSAQVGEAVTQMDQVTQQNAALVEEMAVATAKATPVGGNDDWETF